MVYIKDEMQVREQVKNLYGIYAMECIEEKKEYMVYIYTIGYFKNAEILYFMDNDENLAKQTLTNYSGIGYSARCIKYKDLETTHRSLFFGFFDIENSKIKMGTEYNKFCQEQLRKNNLVAYDYIEPIFAVNNEAGMDQLVTQITNKLFQNGPQLIIVEAAAGFGKTCASYELLNCLPKCKQDIVPIFIELSKNRAASVFRYVLLDEIDRKFSNLKSAVVVNEIKQGKVPLIIDGFDELIGRTSALDEKNSENSQTMLETITELFKDDSKAKIVLTSRKSAIFIGKEFEEWSTRQMSTTCITRVRIEEPTIEKWLGYQKKEFLLSNNIPFDSIKNPILLSFLRACDQNVFERYCQDVETLTECYFETLLSRESERQSLPLNPCEQKSIMVKLAEMFIQLDISSEEVNFVRELLKDIVEKDFSNYRDRYSGKIEERPDEEAFCLKLSAHALLDRVSTNNNQIGFINDFVFGNLIAIAIKENKTIIKYLEEAHISIMCTSLAVCSNERRTEMFELIEQHLTKFSKERQLSTEIALLKTLNQNYTNEYFENISIHQEVFFDGEFSFENCIFRSCTFNKCQMTTKVFLKCTFYACNFFDNNIMKNTTQDVGLIFENCSGEKELQDKSSGLFSSEESEFDYESYILGKFWSKRYSKGKVHQKDLIKGIVHNEIPNIEKALENLRKKEMIFKENQLWCVNKMKMKEIKIKLGK